MLFCNGNIFAFDWTVPLAEDLSPLPEADNGGVTVTESSTPIAESASSKINIALQPKVSENSEDATSRDCSIQYQTSVSPLRGKKIQ